MHNISFTHSCLYIYKNYACNFIFTHQQVWSLFLFAGCWVCVVFCYCGCVLFVVFWWGGWCFFFFFFLGGGQYWGRGRGNFHSNMVLANHKQTHILFSPGYSTNQPTKASAVCQFQPQHNTQHHNCSKLVGRTQTCVLAQQSHHLTATCNDGSSVCKLGEQSMTTKGEEPR